MTRPPRLARWMLRVRPLGNRRADVEADLLELFHARAASAGIRDANRRFYRDVASVWLHGPRRGTGRVSPGGRRLLAATAVVRDLIYATRLFRQHPVLIAITVFGLAVGIAASTTAFTFLNAAVLRPYGVADPDSLMQVTRVSEAGPSGTWALAEYQQLIGRPKLTTLAAARWGGELLVSEERRSEFRKDDVTRVMFVGPGYFSTLGGHATLGRTLGAADEVPGQVPAVVINHRHWTRRFAADDRIVGRTLYFNGTPAVVVGVMQPGFAGATSVPPSFWVSLVAHERILAVRPDSVQVLARLAPTASVAQARAELASLVNGLAPPSDPRVRAIGERVQLDPAGRPTYTGRNILGLWIAIGSVVLVVGLILFLACANATNLLLAGAVSRRREIGVRFALGASRARVVQQLVTESVLLGVISAAAGLVLATWLTPVLAGIADIQPSVDLSLDMRVYLFVSLIALVVGIGAGLAPARHGTRGDLVSPLKGDSASPGAAAGTGRLRAVLIGGQAAASCVLLVMAALLVRASVHASHLDLGMPVERLLVAYPAFNRTYTDSARVAEYWDVARARVAALPFVEAVALTEVAPFGGASQVARLQRGGQPYTINYYPSEGNYFETVGLRLVRGRSYTPDEVATRAPLAVISESLAREFWPGADPVGDSLRHIGDGLADLRVIGVVSDAISARLRDPNAASVYRPIRSFSDAQMVVRVNRAGDESARPVLEALRAIDPALRPSIHTVASRVQNQLDDVQTAATVALALGAIALTLATVGIFGVTAFVVGQRSREISVRIAIGATSADVVRLVLRDSLRPVGIGLAIGLVLALLAGRAIGSLLHGISPYDPLALVGAVLVLLTAAGTAAILPTRRAARLDPAPMLRQ